MKWAKLDEHGLLLAVENERDDDWPHWAGPFDELDNAPGRYVWDGTAFVPVPGFGAKPGGKVPSPQVALYAFLKSEQRQGRVIPPETLRWMEFFKSTVDLLVRDKES